MGEGPGAPRLPAATDFQDPALLERALTHSSTGLADNERLEFLGDAVIGLVVAAQLFREADPAVREGPLTMARARVVSREGLAAAARELGLDEAVRLGPGEERAGGAAKDRILCGAFEALVGALFLDRGYAGAATFVEGCLAGRVRAQSLEEPPKDPKNTLQELAQAGGLEIPVYTVEQESGEPHDPTFEVRVEVGRLTARGIGSSKKEATRDAATRALEQLERFPFALDGDDPAPDA